MLSFALGSAASVPRGVVRERIGMWLYYLFMALMIITLVLWAIIALRDDTRETADAQDAKNGAAVEKSKSPRD
jgi:uncharacterized membrane protein